MIDRVCCMFVVHTMSGIEPPNGGTVLFHLTAGGNVLRGGEASEADADEGVCTTCASRNSCNARNKNSNSEDSAEITLCSCAARRSNTSSGNVLLVKARYASFTVTMVAQVRM